MREFWKKTTTMAAIGFVSGLLVGLVFQLISGFEAYIAEYGMARLVLYFAMSGLLGAVNMGTTTIYSLEHWGLLRCTLTHFVIVMATLCSIGFSMGWMKPNDSFTRWMLVVCVIAYAAIWFIMYARGKRQIRRMNEALERWKAEQGGEDEE